MEEIEIEGLSVKEKAQVLDAHNEQEQRRCIYGSKRELKGWYIKDQFKIKFYYKPSWWSRQKMYWLFGWKWKSYDEKS